MLRRVAASLCALAALVWLSVVAAQSGPRVYLPALSDARSTTTPTATRPATATPTASPTVTATPDPLSQSLRNGGFEQGEAVWATVGVSITQGVALPLPPRSGRYAALVRLDPPYDANPGAMSQELQLPEYPVNLVLYYQLRTTEAECSTTALDRSVIRVEVYLDEPFTLAACAANNTTDWQRVEIDLTTYTGEQNLPLVLRAYLATQNAYVIWDDVHLERRP